MTLVLGACQFVLAAVLLLAAITKIVTPEALTRALRTSGVPLFLIKPLPILVVIVELSLAINLIFSTPETLLISMTGTLVLLSIFTGWLMFVYVRKMRITCGCFGDISASVTKGTLFRNVLLMGLAILGIVLAKSVPSVVPASTTWNMVLSIALSGGAILLLLERQYALGTMFFSYRIRSNKLS